MHLSVVVTQICGTPQTRALMVVAERKEKGKVVARTFRKA